MAATSQLQIGQQMQNYNWMSFKAIYMDIGQISVWQLHCCIINLDNQMFEIRNMLLYKTISQLQIFLNI